MICNLTSTRMGCLALILAAAISTSAASVAVAKPQPSPMRCVPADGVAVFEFDRDFKRLEDRGILVAPILGARQTGATTYRMPIESVDLLDPAFQLNSSGGVEFSNESGRRHGFFNLSLLGERRYLGANHNGPHRVGIFQFSPIMNSFGVKPGRFPLVRFEVALTLSAVAARVLNRAFRTRLFYAGLPVGEAAVRFRLAAADPCWSRMERPLELFGRRFSG